MMIRIYVKCQLWEFSIELLATQKHNKIIRKLIQNYKENYSNRVCAELGILLLACVTLENSRARGGPAMSQTTQMECVWAWIACVQSSLLEKKIQNEDGAFANWAIKIMRAISLPIWMCRCNNSMSNIVGISIDVCRLCFSAVWLCASNRSGLLSRNCCNSRNLHIWWISSNARKWIHQLLASHLQSLHLGTHGFFCFAAFAKSQRRLALVF